MESSDLQELKDAATELMEFTCNSCEQRFCEEDAEEEDGQRVPSLCGPIIRMRNALSANPIRNCDVFNDAESAWRAWLDDSENWDEFGSPELELCEWLFAPAEERKGDCDGR